MNEPPRRSDITIRVAKEAGRHTDPAAFAAAASQAAAGRDASILSAHTAEEIICVVSVCCGHRAASGRRGAGHRGRRAQRWGSAAVTQPVSERCPLSCAARRTSSAAADRGRSCRWPSRAPSPVRVPRLPRPVRRCTASSSPAPCRAIAG